MGVRTSIPKVTNSFAIFQGGGGAARPVPPPDLSMAFMEKYGYVDIWAMSGEKNCMEQFDQCLFVIWKQNSLDAT